MDGEQLFLFCMFYTHADILAVSCDEECTCESESESGGLSAGGAAGITFAITLLVVLPVGVVSLMHSCCTACFVTGFLYYNNLVNISLTHIIIYMLYLPCRG